MQDTLAEIEERGEAVRELEKSLLDLHQIFLDMAVLVEAQGEMLDNIEAQVRLAVDARAGACPSQAVGMAHPAWRIFTGPSLTAAHLHPAQMPCSVPRNLFRLQHGVHSHAQHFSSNARDCSDIRDRSVWLLRQVAKARNHVQQGVTQLVEAKKLQKKTRKLMCCALITILIIIIVIVLAVVQPWKYAQKSS